MSFIQNEAKVKGAAVYISTLSACLWYEEYPFYSVNRAIRWNNTFEYRGNSIHPAKTFKPLQGPEYDIATDTHHFEYEGNNDTEIMVSYFFRSTNLISRIFSLPRGTERTLGTRVSLNTNKRTIPNPPIFDER